MLLSELHDKLDKEQIRRETPVPPLLLTSGDKNPDNTCPDCKVPHALTSQHHTIYGFWQICCYCGFEQYEFVND